MPKKIPEYLKYFLEDCLEGDPCYTIKNMFGWYSVYKQGKIFSVFLMDTIYFKVWENNLSDYKSAGSEPFRYDKKNWEVAVMAYWTLPEEVLENKDELQKWIDKSLKVPVKTVKKKTKKQKELPKKVLESLLKIPKGKVTTYKNLALKFDSHPRAIAQIMRSNKQPIDYPCYKVIASSWKISGYNTKRGVEEKIEKLQADGIKIVDGKIREEFIV